MCRQAALLVAIFASACRPDPTADWSCDFDAHESRPLSDADASTGPDGELPATVCQNTCGQPASTCTLTLLDGGLRGAVCPVCTF